VQAALFVLGLLCFEIWINVLHLVVSDICVDIFDNYDNVPLFTKETVAAAAYHTEEADSGPTLRQLLV
jgi:hypothetical protein